MPEYKTKSPEELRYEDYSVGDSGAAPAAGGFGGSPGFGAQPASQRAFGTAGVFGAATQSRGFLLFTRTFCPRSERIEAVSISSSFTPRRIFL